PRVHPLPAPADDGDRPDPSAHRRPALFRHAPLRRRPDLQARVGRRVVGGVSPRGHGYRVHHVLHDHRPLRLGHGDVSERAQLQGGLHVRLRHALLPAAAGGAGGDPKRPDGPRLPRHRLQEPVRVPARRGHLYHAARPRRAPPQPRHRPRDGAPRVQLRGDRRRAADRLPRYQDATPGPRDRGRLRAGAGRGRLAVGAARGVSRDPTRMARVPRYPARALLSDRLARSIMAVVDRLSRWQAEHGEDSGFRQVGSLKLALTDARVRELEAQVAQARRWGLAVELIAPRDAQTRVPLLETNGVKACVWIPTDGYAEPYTLAMALARAARRLGVKMRTQTPATAITLERGRVTGGDTATGPIACETVVVAVGPWSELIGAALGLAFD